MKQAFCWIQSQTGFHENADMAANELLTLNITISLVLSTDLKPKISLFISKNTLSRSSSQNYRILLDSKSYWHPWK